MAVLQLLVERRSTGQGIQEINQRLLLRDLSSKPLPNLNTLKENSMTSYDFSHYKNLTGRSGVTNYYLGRNKVTVRFKDGSLYTYTDESAGPENIEQMKQPARQGSGLNGYIVRHVYKNYSKKKRKNKR